VALRPLSAADSIAPIADERAYFSQVFGWMAAGLAVTGIIASLIGTSNVALHILLTGNGRLLLIAVVLIELVLVAVLVGLVQHMDVTEAALVFLAYAALNGVVLSLIFAVYTTASIASTFLIAAAMFALLALWGYTTKADLTGWGSFLFMALAGQLIGLIVNFFWLNQTFYWITTATGILIFSGYTAYDVQKLKRYDVPGADQDAVRKEAIVGALALYLDLVNLFLYLLRIFGRRR
jgi:FtsH-binding integral membrane protein